MRKTTGFFLIIVTVFSCTVNNVKHDESLKKYFDEYKVAGCFALYDNSHGEHTVYNEKRDTTRYSPASTFKIVNALVGLQTGRVTSDSSIIKWDSVVRDNPEWNRDLSLYQAFRVSAVPHFQALARMIGRDTLQKWVDSIHYGNKVLGPKLDEAWLNNSLKISADEQVWLVKLLYFRQLPFRQSVQEQVKAMMVRENNTTYQLAYKTGWGKTDNGNELGWIVGWIEENRHVYFFAMNLESPDHSINMQEVRLKILNNILTQIGFFKGKM